MIQPPRVASLDRRLLRVRYHTRTALSAHPGVFLPFVRYRHGRGDTRVVRPGTELVIDGFQRSANTFAVVAFELAQRRPVVIAHHVHAAAQIHEAVKLHVPTILLIRTPDACALSNLIRKPHLTPKLILTSWIRFYESLLPVRDRVVTGRFGAVTVEYGAVIRRVNRAFGTDFREFEHNDANVARCFDVIDRGNRERNGSVVESAVARPSQGRERAKEILLGELEAPSLEGLRASALAVYRAWTVSDDTSP